MHFGLRAGYRINWARALSGAPSPASLRLATLAFNSGIELWRRTLASNSGVELWHLQRIDVRHRCRCRVALSSSKALLSDSG